MDVTTKGQVSRTAADVYEEFFVPALFREWAGPVADAAGIASGHQVLDVACGTGVLAREAERRVGPGGSVTGLDRNEGMLEVARRMAPGIDWKVAPAETLPFANDTFDAVVSQFGLMFFDDRSAALSEMLRVLKPGGRLAVAVWGALDDTPGYAAMTDLLQRLFGIEIADALRAPFALGDRVELAALFVEAGMPDADIATRDGTAHFPSIDAWVHTDVKGWTLADLIDDTQYESLQKEARQTLTPFVQNDGSVAFRSPAHIATVAKS